MSAVVRAWCQCGWHGEFRTQGIADYAYRRHSCEVYERKRERARRILARRQALDRTSRECTHKYAYHEHGTYTRYNLDHCHCDPCRTAKLAYESERRRRAAYGEPCYVDARPAAQYVRKLMAAGMGWKRVARAAGLDGSLVYPLLYGRPDRRGGAPRTKARPETVAAILAVPMPTEDDLAGGISTDSTGTVRRVQALACLGWSVTAIAERAGCDRQALDRALHDGGLVTLRTVRGVRAAYDTLWHEQAPPGSGSTRVRNRALAAGWAPPLAWDDEEIDDPAATPDLGERAQGVDIDEWLFLVRAGEHGQRAAKRLGVSIKAIEKAAFRHDRQDVLRYLSGLRRAA